MTTLNDLVINKKQVLGVEVYALTLNDIASLLSNHREAIKALFTNQDLEQVLIQFPKFIVDVIAKGTKSDPKIAEQVPAGRQLELLIGIWEVSQINMDLLGKVMKGVAMNLETLNSPLQNGKTPSRK